MQAALLNHKLKIYPPVKYSFPEIPPADFPESDLSPDAAQRHVTVPHQESLVTVLLSLPRPCGTGYWNQENCRKKIRHQLPYSLSRQLSAGRRVLFRLNGRWFLLDNAGPYDESNPNFPDKQFPFKGRFQFYLTGGIITGSVHFDSAAAASEPLRQKDFTARMEATQHPLETIATGKQVMPSAKDYRVGHPSETIPGVVENPAFGSPTIRLNADDIDHPAIVIDSRLRVVWCNTAAADKIWHHCIKDNNGASKPDLFALLFDPKFRQTVDNWRSWLAFFVEQFKSVIPSKTFRHCIAQMAPAKKDILSSLLNTYPEEPASAHSLYSGIVRQLLATGEVVAFHAVATNFKAGRLIVFEPVKTDPSQGDGFRKHRIEHRIRNIARHPNPVQMPLCILSAELDQPEVLKLETLDGEYSAMTSAIWNKCIVILETYGGIFGKHSDTGFYGHFLPGDEFENNVQSIIECSLEIKTQVAELSREYKLRRAWSHDIELNMGLHKEQAYVGALSSSAGDTLSGFGVGLRLATRLSSLACGGQILATKSLFDQMPADVLSRLRFGTYRRETGRRGAFVPKCFSDIGAFSDSANYSAVLQEELKGVGVTQVFDFHA